MSGPGDFAYQDHYTPTFSKNYKRYGNIQERIGRCIDKILLDPFSGTEPLEHKAGFDLRGLRSARIDRNFRIIFCVWEEYQKKSGKAVPLLPVSMRDKITSNIVVFLTVGPHENAYTLK